MKKYGKVRSTQQPESKVIDDFSVWLAENITPVQEEATGENETGFTGFEYDLTQYTKDEYINMIDDKNAALGEEVTNTQIALCEVYELIG